MKQFGIRVTLFLSLSTLAVSAHAVITCTSVTSPGFSTAYSGVVNNVTATFFTATCSRSSLADAATVTYQVGVNNGLNNAGGQNRAKLGANFISYDTYKDAGCTTLWKLNGGTRITDTITLNGTLATTKQTTFYGCITVANQVVPAGIYVDTLNMTLSYPGGSVGGAFGANIATPATCSITTAPSTLTFNYTAFGAAVNNSTNYQITCTSFLAYAMSLGATNPVSGVASGINYSLTLGTTSSTGTGAAQTFSIAGAAAASQAGTCGAASCSATNVHTLTITY